MECNETAIMRYVDGEPISPGERAHIEGCAQCREEVEKLRQLRKVLEKYLALRLKEDDCPWLDELVGLFLSGQPMPPKLLDHLEKCVVCRMMLDGLRAWEEEFVEPDAPLPLPPELQARVKELRQGSLKKRLTDSLGGMGRKAGSLVEQLLSPGAPAPAPAAPDDLTDVEEESEGDGEEE